MAETRLATSDSRSPMVARLRPQDLSDEVTSALREMILSKRVLAGARLVETELSAQFGTSRGPVRDAFKALERSGLVVTVPRRGTFVAELTAVDIAEIYTLRAALEDLAVQQITETATDADIAAMQSALDDIEAAEGRGDGRASGEADMRFHRTIVELAGHERLLGAWERLADQTLLLMGELVRVAPDVSSADDHRPILTAIAARDTEAARAAVRDHLIAAREAMVADADT